MKLWSIDVEITATAYIKAKTQAEAQKIADELNDSELVFSDRLMMPIEGPAIYGGECSSPRMPVISLSPAMTIHGARDGTTQRDVVLVE